MTSLGDICAGLERPPIGAWIKLEGEESCEIVARSGFDFLVIDLEHSQLRAESVYRLIATASLAQVATFVRNPDLNRVAYQKLLDAGAQGILAPQLENFFDVQAGLSFCLYPPSGIRGFSTTTRAGEWGGRSRKDHIERSNREVAFIPQLESRIALDLLSEIVSLDGLDAVFIGMADLSVSLGVAPDDPELLLLVDRAISVCHLNNVLVGTAISNVRSVRDWALDGFDFLMVGDDASMLAASARNLILQSLSSLKDLS